MNNAKSLRRNSYLKIEEYKVILNQFLILFTIKTPQRMYISAVTVVMSRRNFNLELVISKKPKSKVFKSKNGHNINKTIKKICFPTN